MNVNQNEPRIILKDESGRFSKHIKLGENFISQMNNMSENLNILLKESEELNHGIRSLDLKLNSILVNKIIYYYQGIEFTADGDLKQSIVSVSNFINVLENISDALCSLIYDFSSNRESGDPEVIHDHIIFLSTIYKRLHSLKSFKSLLSTRQYEMIENQFQQCFLMFNNLIDNAIRKNKWDSIVDFICILLGMEAQPCPSGYDIYYLQNCRLALEEIDENKNVLEIKTVKKINKCK